MESEFPLHTPQQVGLCLRTRRKSLNLTQAEIAGLAGLLPKTISALENDPERCSVESLLKLCAFLGLEFYLQPKPGDDADDDA